MARAVSDNTQTTHSPVTNLAPSSLFDTDRCDAHTLFSTAYTFHSPTRYVKYCDIVLLLYLQTEKHLLQHTFKLLDLDKI